MATRWRSPPDSVAGLRSSRWEIPRNSTIGVKLHAALPEAVAQVSPHRQVGQEQGVLEDIADAAFMYGKIYLCLAVKQHFAANADTAAVWLFQPCDQVQEA